LAQTQETIKSLPTEMYIATQLCCIWSISFLAFAYRLFQDSIRTLTYHKMFEDSVLTRLASIHTLSIPPHELTRISPRRSNTLLSCQYTPSSWNYLLLPARLDTRYHHIKLYQVPNRKYTTSTAESVLHMSTYLTIQLAVPNHTHPLNCGIMNYHPCIIPIHSLL
jgi:hypothetical protein